MGKADATDPWAGSPFEWLMRLASRSRGRAGELIVESWLDGLGFDVRSPTNSGHDRTISGRKVEIKFSTLWGSGEYVFQQLRDQDYEVAILLGVSPTAAQCWVIPKAEAFARAVPQHGGAAGRDTRWLRIRAAEPPTWMRPFGGELGATVPVLISTFGGRSL
jgi:hypothetical protein